MGRPILAVAVEDLDGHLSHDGPACLANPVGQMLPDGRCLGLSLDQLRRGEVLQEGPVHEAVVRFGLIRAQVGQDPGPAGTEGQELVRGLAGVVGVGVTLDQHFVGEKPLDLRSWHGLPTVGVGEDPPGQMLDGGPDG